MSKRLMLLVGLAAATAAFGSVMDEAKFWWKFDQGGADGAVVQTSEIHDCRDASVGVASRTSGPSGGPIWTNMTVQLPYRGLEVQSSAINIQVITNASKQIRPSMVDVSGCVNSDVATFFARVCPGETLNDGVNYVGTDERFIFNDNFYWGNSKANSYGYLFGFARRNATSYYPKIFIGQEQDTFSGIALETGKWYDLAFSVSMVTNMTSTTHTDITTNDVTGVTTTNVTTSVTTSIVQRALCVVAGENGLFYQTADNAYQRQVPFAGTTGRIGGQQFVSSWVTSVGGNQVNAKDYNGLIHEMALWNRAMNLGEILNVFGRPEAPEGGDVFTDVFRWWKFDRDLDGDGKVSANELRDVRKWGTAAAPAAGNPEVEYVTDGGPLTWQNMSVHKPARGETVAADCLLMEPQYRENADTSFEVWCPHVRFKDSVVAGDLTFMARICITKPYDYYSGGKSCYLFQNSFSYGSGSDPINAGGYQIGIATSGNTMTSFVPLFYGGRNSTTASLTLTTNVWYDIAYTISVQTNGQDRLTVTLADAQHGIRTWAGTITTSQRQKTGTTLMLNGENDLRGWNIYRNADGTIKNVNALKIFTGAINQIAIWKRALSTDEIAAAFGYPRAAFGVGSRDGTADEFGVASEGSYDYTVSDTWHDMAGTLDSTHRTLTLRFTPPPNWNGMDQGFHLVVGDVSGTDAQVSLAVNGARFGSKAVATGDDVWWIVKGGAVHAGENVATLTLGGTGSLAIDKLEMLGSWALVSGGAGGEFSHEGNPQGKDFYVGDRNMTHVTRAVVNDHPSNRLHFWLPAELAENYPFEFTFRTHANANGTAAFKIFINGEELFDAPNGLVNQERTFEFAPGALRAGWNVIEPHYQTGGGAWAQWIRYTLKMLGPDFGTILMVR